MSSSSIPLPTKSTLAWTVVWMVCCLAFAPTTEAQQAADAPAPFGPLNPANWKVPEFKMPSITNLLPGQEEKQRITEKKDSLFGEVGNSFKKSWEKTKQAFNPQKLNPFKFSSSKTETKKADAKPGFFHSLFSPPEPKPAESVSEFLSQDRIGP